MEHLRSAPAPVEHIPQPVREVTNGVLDMLDWFKISFNTVTYDESPYEVLINIDNNSPLSIETFNTIVNSCAQHGVGITFEQDRQLIKIAPLLN